MEAALQTQREFEQQLVGIVSHDLRDPLNTIVLAAERLARVELGDEATRYVRAIRSSAGRATRLVRDLLDFTQARLGRGIGIARSEVDLRLSIEQALDEMQAAFPGREVRFHASGETLGAWDGDRSLRS